MIEKKNDYEGSHSRRNIRNIVSLIIPPEKVNHFFIFAPIYFIVLYLLER